MDTVCPICLRTIHNLAVLDCCKHTFCKKCIMAWMKRTDSCPLCKLHVGTVITDIITPSQYSQYLPNGKLLYSHYNPNRKAIYTLKLVNNPSYEKEIFPNDLSKCSYINEWITREIESILPGIDSSFFVSMIVEGLNRYGSRDERIQQRIAEVVGSYATTFIRELENCVCCQAKSLKEYDGIVSYCYPSLAETIDYNNDSLSLDLNDAVELYQKQTHEYNSVEEEMYQLLETCPDIEDKAKQRMHELHKCTRKETTLQKEKTLNSPCAHVDDDPYADYRDWEVKD